MEYAQPTKESDVTVSINPGNDQGTDQNGLIVGRWKTGIFGFTDSCMPNGLMACFCPAVSVAQIAARLGMMSFKHVLAAFAGLYLLAFIGACADSGFVDFLVVVACISAALCCMRMRWRIRSLFSIPGSHAEDAFFSFCCGCCSIAQMASHVESYEPGSCAFAPRATLQGYSFN